MRHGRRRLGTIYTVAERLGSASSRAVAPSVPICDLSVSRLSAVWPIIEHMFDIEDAQLVAAWPRAQTARRTYLMLPGSSSTSSSVRAVEYASAIASNGSLDDREPRSSWAVLTSRVASRSVRRRSLRSSSRA
jgi:hypothetical protein